MNHDTPEAIAITDKAARELMEHEKALQVKHTPAPWRYDYEDGYCGEIIAFDGSCVATFCDEPSAENSRLIAAAPETAAERDKLKAINSELLEALKEIDERLTACLYGNIYTYEAYDSYYQSVVRDAIAKATGEQHGI
jgi:hypothetical protein